jgi:hypothetical protein
MSWIFKRKKKKKLDFSEIKKLNKENLEAFLKEVSKSVDISFSGQESNYLEKQFAKEVDSWLKVTIFASKELDIDAVKLGICLGLKEGLRKVNEAEEMRRVTYIS